MKTLISMNRFPTMPHGQRGTALVMAMVILLVMTLLGITSFNMTTLEEKMAGNTKDRILAFQASETALLAGENTVGSAITINAVVAAATVTNDGLHKPSSTSTPVWDSAGVWTGSDNRTYAGLTKVAQQPKYIIEDLGQIEDKGGSLVLPKNYKSSGKNLFRITSRGVGGTASAVVMVQSAYEKRF